VSRGRPLRHKGQLEVVDDAVHLGIIGRERYCRLKSKRKLKQAAGQVFVSVVHEPGVFGLRKIIFPDGREHLDNNAILEDVHAVADAAGDIPAVSGPGIERFRGDNECHPA
jgi:hypothetical protein